MFERVLLVGYFGYDNFGDELALKSFLRLTSKDVKYSILSFKDDYTEFGLETYYWKNTKVQNVLQFLKLLVKHQKLFG